MSLLEKIQKHHIRNFFESTLIVTVAILIFFFAPLIRWTVIEGFTLARCYYHPPMGHGLPLGAHRAPEVTEVTEVSDWPTPLRYFDEFVMENKPFLLKHMAKTFPGFKLWSDAYLKKASGELTVNIQNASGHVSRTSYDSFLERYPKERVHFQHSVPDSLLGDLSVPRMTSCGNFPAAFRSVSLWMNGGNLTQALSGEAGDTITCNFGGSQSIILVNRLYENLAREAASASLEDTNLDLCRKRNLQNLPWHDVRLEEGDCFFIPSRWHKQIRFHESRNLGVTFQYWRLLYFNQSDCENPKAARLISPGSEELLKYEIITLAENHATLDLYTFEKVFLMPNINDPQLLAQLFDLLDRDGDREVTPEELYSLPGDDFVKFFPNFRSDKKPER